MPGTRLPHLKEVEVEKRLTDENLQSSAAQHPNLRDSGDRTNKVRPS